MHVAVIYFSVTGLNFIAIEMIRCREQTSYYYRYYSNLLLFNTKQRSVSAIWTNMSVGLSL